MNRLNTEQLPNAVNTAFAGLLARTNYLTPHGKELLIAAFWFAYHAHRNQLRASKEPYILHPIAVCCSLAELNLDVDALMAALLHDTVEDIADISQDDILNKFGSVVAFLVDSVTKLEEYDKRAQPFFDNKNATVKERQAANLQYLLLSSAKDLRALIIKLADRLHNMQTLDHLKPEKQQRIAEETLAVYAPLASLIGMRRWKNEIENLAFKTLHPKYYRNIAHTTETVFDGINQKVIDDLCNEFTEKLAKAGIPVRQVYGRIKTPYSIWRKSESKNLQVPKLMDLVAFRIIVESQRYCYRALEVIHRNYEYLQNSLDDYVSQPKSNGYRSLHTVVMLPKRAEIQIRSKAMHQVAESGIAAHWRYKNSATLSPEASDLIAKLRLDDDDKKTSPLVMEDLNLDSLSNEVVAYTPQGHLARLQGDATVLDFAFHIHTEVGLKFKEALVNGNNVVMGHPLSQGDEVEIITSEESRPEEYWKRYAKTHRALSAIQQVLSAESLRYFKEFILDIARQHHVDMVTKIDLIVMRKVFNRLGVKNLSDLEEGLVKGHIVPNEVLHAVQPNLKIQKITGIVKKNTITITSQVDKVQRCHLCLPVPGDTMRGVLIVNKGTVAHRKDCKILSSDINTHCFITDVLLERPGTEQEYPVLLDCIMTNRPGMLGVITTAIGERGINLQDIAFLNREEKRYHMRFSLLVQHKGQMDGLEKTVRARASDSIEIYRPVLEPKIVLRPENDEN